MGVSGMRVLRVMTVSTLFKPPAELRWKELVLPLLVPA